MKNMSRYLRNKMKINLLLKKKKKKNPRTFLINKWHNCLFFILKLKTLVVALDKGYIMFKRTD